MTEIKDGLQLPLSRLLNDQLTFKGKPISFEKLSEEQPNIYRASTNLSEEEKKHNRDWEFIFSLEEAIGTVRASLVPLEDNSDEFKDLTDAERVTKTNSLTFQLKQPEPTDVGPNLNQTLNKAVNESSTTNKNKQETAEKQEETKQSIPRPATKPVQTRRASDNDDCD